MHIEFQSIRFKNFLSVGNEWATFPLNKDDLLVIIGENGTGKSALLDALIYVLYNKAFRKVNLGQLINTFNKKNLLVEVVFSIANDTYVVRRGQKPKIFEIYKNKQLIEEDSSGRDYQAMLEEDILRVNQKTFTQINILGKATYVPFMNLTPAHRREVVEDLLDSRVYSIMQAFAKDDLKNLKPQIKEVEDEIRIVDAMIQSNKALLAKYSADKSSQIQAKKQQIASLKTEEQQATEKLGEIQKRYEEKRNELGTIGVDPAKVDSALNDLTADIRIHQAEISRANATISKVDGLDNCPACLQPVDSNHRDHIISDNNKTIEEAEGKIAAIAPKVTKLKELKDKISNINRETTLLEREELQEHNRIENIRSNAKRIYEEIQTLELPTEIPDIEPTEQLEAKKDSFDEQRDALIEQGNKLDKVIKFLADDGIKAKLIEQYIPAINSYINSYLEQMDLFASFELDGEFNEKIKSHYRDTFSYHSFSEGQKMRIDLAIMLTWRQIAKKRNSTSTNILIMDEIFDGSLSADGATQFMSILKTMDISQNMIVISHNENTIDMFDNVVKVSINGNYSEYERI